MHGKVSEKFLNELCDDLNTPNALAEMYEEIKHVNQALRNNPFSLDELVKAYSTLKAEIDLLGLPIESKKLNDEEISLYKEYQKAKDNKLFTIDASNYDGSVSMEQMGNLSPEEERAYLKARNHYLEEMLLAQKKIRSELEEFFT